MRITDVCVGMPGSTHDARVLRLSTLWESGRNKCQNGLYHVLGDAAYPLQDWLLTPYRNVGILTPQQTLYNALHGSKRRIIERTFGVLKRRWRRLGSGIQMDDMAEVNGLIMSACCLHNLCVLWHCDLEEDEEEEVNIANVNYAHNAVANDAGQAKRNDITLNL